MCSSRLRWPALHCGSTATPHKHLSFVFNTCQVRFPWFLSILYMEKAHSFREATLILASWLRNPDNFVLKPYRSSSSLGLVPYWDRPPICPSLSKVLLQPKCCTSPTPHHQPWTEVVDSKNVSLSAGQPSYWALQNKLSSSVVLRTTKHRKAIDRTEKL